MDTRRLFSYEERKQILEKSNGLCSHCGVDVREYFTVDHVIPLSRGGTNDLSNLVPLCESCNREKDNLIIHPSDYFKFLSKSAMQDLLANQNKYYSEVDWLTLQSFLPEDIKEISVAYSVNPDAFLCNILFGSTKKRKKASPFANIKLLITKTTLDELDDVIEFGLKHTEEAYRSQSSRYTDKDMKEMRKSYRDGYMACYSRGAIYCIRNKDYSLKGIVPVMFDDFNEDCLFDSGNTEKRGVVPTFVFPVLEKDDPNFGLALARVYAYILSSLRKKLNMPVYFIAADLGIQVASAFAGCCFNEFASKFFEENYFNTNKSISLGVWDRDDDSILDGVSASALKHRGMHQYAKDRVEIQREHKDIRLAYLTGSDDFDGYMRDARVFSKKLANLLGVKTYIPTKRVECKTIYDESFEMSVDDIWVTDGVVQKPISKVLQKQVQTGGIRPLRLTSDNRVCSGDEQLFLYLKSLGYKKVKCYYRKNKNN